MRLSFYKPNPRVLGAACNFNYDEKKNSFYLGFIRQSAWDDKTKRGSFADNRADSSKTASVKLSDTEIAGMILAIRESNKPFSFVHKSPAGTSNGNFKPYLQGEKCVGMSLGINVSSPTGEKKNFLMGFNFPESEMLSRFLKLVLDKKLMADVTIEPQSNPDGE